MQNGAISKYVKDFVCDITDPAEKISHTPDGVFALDKGAKTALFFLEVDRGTEVITDEEKGVLKHVRFYLNYLPSGRYRRYEEDFSCEDLKGFRALFVTTSEMRVENIRHAISRLPVEARAKQFIWLTDKESIAAAGVFGSVWRSGDLGDSHTYRIG